MPIGCAKHAARIARICTRSTHQPLAAGALAAAPQLVVSVLLEGAGAATAGVATAGVAAGGALESEVSSRGAGED